MLNSAIELDLSGPSKARRLSRLEALLQNESVDSDVVRISLAIESVPATITDYRDRERHLESLLKTLRQDGPSKSEETQVVAFRHLLGSLYVNFEKFWGPTIRVIVDHLHQTKFQAQLLRILLGHLKETNDIIYNENLSVDSTTTEDRPDHILHRNFIFQLLTKFARFVESNGAIFMDQFFLFVQKELLCSPFIERFTRDDLVAKGRDCDPEADEEIFEDALEDPLEDQPRGKGDKKKGFQKQASKRPPISAALLQKRKSRETFITVAKIIQSFEDISNVHREAELKELLMDLLCCRDSSVQKASFNCLLTYNHEHLRPYVNNILKILSDKMVRTELVMLSVDATESDQIQDEHRAHLMPILLRILFGKMIGRIGRKSSGRDKADLRKALVMRFIAGCTVEEITYFFSLLFDPIFTFVRTPYDQLEIELRRDINLNQYVPLNKLQAMLNTLMAYMESVAHLKEDSLVTVLKLINIITYQVVAPLEDTQLHANISEKNIDSLKVLKRACLNTTAEFFRMFEYYRFQQDEINFTFKYLIWSSTQGFVDRNHASPTPMLKLIEALSSNRVYHRLLVKRNKNNSGEYLLQHVIDLYVDTKTQRPIIKFIASILANIIDPDRNSPENGDDVEENSVKTPMLEDEDALIPSYDISSYKVDVDLIFSHRILIGFIPAIFERLKKSCQDFLEKKDTDYRIENDELLVLSTLSDHLKNSEQSLLGSRLLLTTLEHQKKGDLILNTLKTVQILLKQVDTISDSTIVPLVANTLSYQRNLDQRDELCNLIEVLAQIDANLEPVSRIIRLLNSRSSGEFADSPDLVKWNDGFRLAFQFIDGLDEARVNQQEVVKDSFILLLYQTGFIANNIDRHDFSIRENCMVFYEKMAQKVKLIDNERNSAFLHLIINEILLEKFIKRGMRETNDAIKHTFIGILRSVALHCHEKNKILGEFYLFCNENQDLDFWLNIRHIQLHSRSKALARLIANEDLNRVSPKTLSAYFMPIAAGFLFSKTYKSVSSLAENSIKLIGMICKRLNWVTYESTLSYYLDLLTKANATYQRTNIKLITEILKNFNFDITACKEAMENEGENAKLEKRMKKRRGEKAAGDESEVIATDAPSGKRLNPSTARMVYFSVTKKLIPRLNSCLHEMTRVEFEADKNMAEYLPEKEEIKRIPMAYAIVQLLNLLPGRYVLFRDHLPSLFLKLSSFLKSKNEQVRKAARSILVKVMSFVGPAYMPDLLRILKQNLDKGFQIHVLNYTIHSVLEKLPIKYGDLDHSVHELVNSCFQEIFGKMSEDKEIAQILAKTFEAKKTKSYDTLLILSSHISAEKLDYLMTSIKEVLKTSSEPKKVNRLSICIQRVFTGLAKNEQFPLDKLLTFIQLTIEESIPSLKVRQKIDQVEMPGRKKFAPNSKNPLREDRYIIEKDLPRDRIKSKINEKGNFHMVVENCLRLLLHTFEKNKLIIRRKENHKKKLDGFITLLSTCLKSSSPKCVMRALKCIHFIAQAKADLPSFKTKCNSIVKKIFILLNLYNGVGMVQGDNFEMIGMCFKTITLLLLRCEHVQLNDDQVRALLTYIEQDLYDTSRQATAFGALHSLLVKKCNSPELVEIMVKIADLLVTSEDSKVRSLSIKIWQTYLLDYKHEGNMLQVHLTKFLRQLEYEYIDGRRSIIKILTIVVTKFPETLLREYFELMFHLLAQRVVNEDSKEVRGLVAKLMGLLIQRLPDQQAYSFRKFVIPWASDANAELKLLGIKTISVFIESCKSIFINDKEKKMKILSIISEALERKEEEVAEDENGNSEPEEDEETQDISKAKDVRLVSVNDKLNYHLLRLFKRLLDHKLISPIETRYIDHLRKIWQNIASQKLSNWHLPTVMTSCELYMIFMKATNLAKAIDVQNPTTDNYLDWNAKRIVRTLCDKYIDLLDRADESSQLFGYVTESMIYLGQIIANSQATLKFEKEYSSSFENGDILAHLLAMSELPNDGFAQTHLPYKINEAKKHLDLMWLSVKVVMQARKEAALYRLSKNHRRSFVLQWSAAILQVLGPRRVAPYAVLLTMTPVRELTDKGKNKSTDTSAQQNLLIMAEDLLKFVKTLTGVEAFNKIYSRVQLHYTRKRVDRKKKEALMKVKDQTRGLKRKTSCSSLDWTTNPGPRKDRRR